MGPCKRYFVPEYTTTEGLGMRRGRNRRGKGDCPKDLNRGRLGTLMESSEIQTSLSDGRSETRYPSTMLRVACIPTEIER